MKYLFIFIFFLNSALYSQSNEKTDSISYYGNLSKVNLLDNKYKNALFYTQKAISYSKEIRN
ncbi:MAG TPA: hypothetical protein VF842_05080, partial [Flavobacterium sp.]